VPRYYFNIHCGEQEATDTVGHVCSDDVAALGQAVRVAGDLIRERLTRDVPMVEGCIEIEDQRHRAIMRLPLRAAAY